MFRKQLAPFAIALFLVVATPCSYANAALERCKEYVEYGVPGAEGTLLCRKGYLLAHDSARKTPIWVAERLTREKASTALARTNNFQPDPDLEVGKRAGSVALLIKSRNFPGKELRPSNWTDFPR